MHDELGVSEDAALENVAGELENATLENVAIVENVILDRVVTDRVEEIVIPDLQSSLDANYNDDMVEKNLWKMPVTIHIQIHRTRWYQTIFRIHR